MDSAIMIHKAGNSTKSRYGVNTLNPTAPSKITRIGVKQHKATSTVPANAANMPFFEVFDEILSIGGLPIIQAIIDQHGYDMGTPSPADLRTSTSGPRPSQQSASLPSITTAGTDLMPRPLARLDTVGSFISRMVTSQDAHALSLTIVIASWQTGHPALKISILRVLFMLKSPL
jgi:hypothetical protein